MRKEPEMAGKLNQMPSVWMPQFCVKSGAAGLRGLRYLPVSGECQAPGDRRALGDAPTVARGKE